MGHYKTYPPPLLKVWTGRRVINFCQSPTYLMKQRMIDEEAIKLFSSTMVPPDVQVILDVTPVNRKIQKCSLGYIAGWSARESKNVNYKEINPDYLEVEDNYEWTRQLSRSMLHIKFSPWWMQIISVILDFPSRDII